MNLNPLIPWAPVWIILLIFTHALISNELQDFAFLLSRRRASTDPYLKPKSTDVPLAGRSRNHSDGHSHRASLQAPGGGSKAADAEGHGESQPQYEEGYVLPHKGRPATSNQSTLPVSSPSLSPVVTLIVIGITSNEYRRVVYIWRSRQTLSTPTRTDATGEP